MRQGNRNGRGEVGRPILCNRTNIKNDDFPTPDALDQFATADRMNFIDAREDAAILHQTTCEAALPQNHGLSTILLSCVRLGSNGSCSGARIYVATNGEGTDLTGARLMRRS